jgi:hypothetical protein
MSVEIAIPSTAQAVTSFWGSKALKMKETEQSYRAEFDRLANDQGLVRMKFVQPESPYMPGEIYGLYVDEALAMLSHEKAAPCDENGEFIPLRKSVKRSEVPQASNSVEIPDDWSALHHLQRIRIANQIRGSDERMKLEEADEIIRAEVERRKQ